MQYITVNHITISFGFPMSLLRHTHGSTIPRLTALLFGHKRFVLRIYSRLQSVKKTCNCRCKRTKYSVWTDKKRRYGRSDDKAKVVIAEL